MGIMSALAESITDHWARQLERDRGDSWQNTRTGLGVAGHDPSTVAALGRSRHMTDGDLEELWRFNVYAERQVEELPRHAMRDGYTVDTAGEVEETVIEEWASQWRLARRVRDAVMAARAYGDGYLLLVTDDPAQSLRDPLPEDGYSLLNIVALSRPECIPHTWSSDITRRDEFGEAVLYHVQPQTVGGVASDVVHASRLIPFAGKRLSRILRAQTGGYNDSVLVSSEAQTRRQTVLEQALEGLLHELKVSVVKINHARSKAEGGGNNSTSAVARVRLMNKVKSLFNMVLLDAGEDFVQNTLNLSGVGDVADRVAQGLAAASRGMPLTLLFGTAPPGLSTDDESGARNWQLQIDDFREDELKPGLERLWYVILGATNGPTAGMRPKRVGIEFLGGDLLTEEGDEPDPSNAAPVPLPGIGDEPDDGTGDPPAPPPEPPE